MAKAMRLHRLGFLLGEAGGETVDLAYGEFIQAQVDELTKTVDKTLEVVAKVHTDRGLNKKGVVERLQEIGNTARDQVRKLAARRRKTLDDDFAAAQAEIPTRLASTRPKTEVIESLVKGDPTLRQQVTDLSQQLKLQEIRKFLLGFTEKGLVEAELLSGAESDLDLLLSIETAPKLIRDKLVNPDVFEEAKKKWFEKNRPDQFQRLSTVEAAIGLFTHNAQQADKLIAQATLQPLRNDVPTQAELERSLAATG